MQPNAQAYAARRMSAAAAARLIPSGARIVMGLGVSQPPALLRALAQRAEAGEVGDLSLYYLLAFASAAPLLRSDLRHRVRPVSLFHGGLERALDKEAGLHGLPVVDFIPTAFSQAPHVLSRQVDADVLLTTVAPMDSDGCFSLGTNTDYALAVSESARQVILEVNPAMPRALGNCRVPLDRVTALVENPVPLLEVPPAKIRDNDRTIGRLIADLVEDGACLQMGIGALPDAVCAALHDRRHMGIHTELMTPGLAELMRRGAVDNSRKTIHTGRTVFTFAMGDRALYDFLDGNPACEAQPVDYVNNPAVIARNDAMVSVNATLEVDLQGACNSECLAGWQYSAAGGQLDFVRGASASKGGKSIIACHSTAAGGTASRIVPRLTGPVTTPRNDVQYVATEFGVVNLRGLTLAERAQALIGIAHPDFREGLERAAHAAARGC
ncbi:acetyl-CoA hydrolase/transferase family protein [Nitrospirillum sp. BR 11163]|uniref:acetyl-CoA hydrolase/transferase family protein n=1 Tax=Nitrospirillum sp. BR 11163 TaxID=3104323 RepID=UPI002AFFCE56|nr:acetyl-CoA hydrolase/transferase C-terminal domain-containing protein [Nitrospirillum sp. BR 11163]MEA1673858.1 acetyl-CoA hydrolase/transferase C-terminal domain-containing protein [Nitrospirillum sp. BR 11163]